MGNLNKPRKNVQVCHRYYYFVPWNIPKSNIDPEQRFKQSPQTLQNVRSTNYYIPKSPLATSPKPSILKTTKLCNRNTVCSMDSFIDTLIKGSETVINTAIDQCLSTMVVIERNLEWRNLSPMELLRFNGNPSHWPEFIHVLKRESIWKEHFQIAFEWNVC